MMTRIIAVLLLAASAAAFGAGPSPKTPPPFALTITTDKPTVRAGAELWVKVQMKNISNRDVDCSSVYVNGTDRRYQYDVRGETGLSMKKTNEHPELVPGSIQLCTLKPGESVTQDTRISWLHDLSHPGKYTVQVSRGASDNEGDGVVKSNTITITVTQ
jgi:hypothetical protein